MKTGKLNKAAIPTALLLPMKHIYATLIPETIPAKKLVTDKTIQITYKDRPIP